jgi:DNA-binding CsgD family transcriptional regulator
VSDLITSPVLVGRDELLALADRRLHQAASGHGHLLLVSGEAGSGKTRLLGSISRRAELAQFTVLSAAAFPGDADASGGVLLDLAGDLRRSVAVGMQAAGGSIARRLRDPLSAAGDRHRQRRLLVQDVADSLSGLDPGGRLLILLEDLHWADPLSLDVLRHIAGRLAARPTLLVAAYRSDELYPGSPIREWRSRLLSQRLAEEVRVPRLSAAQTATLVSAVLGRAAPAQLVTAIHARSDGIPLHVEELLAAGDILEPSRLTFPDTLADAVLARAQALDGEARDIGAAAAVIGRSFDLDLLTAVSQADPAAVDRSLRLLRSLYFVQAGADGLTFDFRHALIRDALYDDVPLPRRTALHERVALAAVLRGDRAAFISAHFEQAKLSEKAYQYAILGAQETSRISAHREALQLYRRAERSLSPGTAVAEQAHLMAAIGAEAAALDQNADAADAYAKAHRLWLQAGEAVEAASVVPPLVAVRHLLGDPLEQRVRLLQEALAGLDGAPDAMRVRARVLSGLAAAYMLDRRLDEAVEYGQQSTALSVAAGDEAAALDTAATQGSVLLFRGQAAGWSLLERTVDTCVASLQEAEAARAYRMAGSCASVLVEYDKAERWLTRGIDYAGAVELWNHRSYMAAHLAHVQWACGDWDSAQRIAESALADGRGGITTRITAQYVLGYLAMGRGDLSMATALLTEALEIGESMNELQRVSPPLWGLAETVLLADNPTAAIDLCDRGFAASDRVADAAYLFPFVVTGTRARLAVDDAGGAAQWLSRVREPLQRRNIPGTLPALAHARGLLQLANGEVEAAGESLLEARVAWDERRRFWEGSWAALDAARCAAGGRRHFEASALADIVRARAVKVGCVSLVSAADQLRASRPAAQAWHPLTAREWAVAQLVATGLTNRQIAAELFLSPKTVGTHVEHVLAKLGARRRAEIAAWATRIHA